MNCGDSENHARCLAFTAPASGAVGAMRNRKNAF